MPRVTQHQAVFENRQPNSHTEEPATPLPLNRLYLLKSEKVELNWPKNNKGYCFLTLPSPSLHPATTFWFISKTPLHFMSRIKYNAHVLKRL
jgi:hypothetical protein